MKIKFNSLGAVIETITNDEPLRQGNVGNTLTATFEGKYNGDYIASLSYKRSDGSVLPLSVFLTPSTTERDTYTFTFSEAWYFALYGETIIHIDLTDSLGNVVVSGEIQYSIEQTIYASKPTITIDEYNNLVTLIAGKMPIPEKAIILEWGEELPQVGEPNTLYFKPIDADSTNYDRYWFNYSTQEYEYLGKIDFDLTQYQKTKEKGKPNGYAPLDSEGKIKNSYLYGDLPQVVLGRYISPTQFNDLQGQPIQGEINKLYVDVDTDNEYIFNPTNNKYILQSAQIAKAINVSYDKNKSNLSAINVQEALDEIAYKYFGVFDEAMFTDISTNCHSQQLIHFEFEGGTMSGISPYGSYVGVYSVEVDTLAMIGGLGLIVVKNTSDGLIATLTSKEELDKKLNVKPLVWSTLPDGATDKKTFYNKTIATLRTATNKIYMWGAPEETPIKEFFDIWGKPTDFKATHIYIVIESISNTSSRDSFKMTIHSSNYANMYFMVVNGYAGQLVGNGSGWISYNSLNENAQKQLAKVDGLYELMTVGFALGLIDPLSKEPTKSTFTEQITADNTSVENGISVVNVIGGNTYVYNQLVNKLVETYTDASGITITNLGNRKLKLHGANTSGSEVAIVLTLNDWSYIKGHHYLFASNQNKDLPIGAEISFGYLIRTSGNEKALIYSRNIEPSTNDRGIVLFVQPNTTFDNVELELSINDLTHQFGSGNEPDTPEQAYKMGVLRGYGAYSDGTLFSAKPSKLTSIGTNLFDLPLEMGRIATDGTDVDATDVIRTKGFIDVIPNRNLYLKWFGNETKYAYMWYYDSNENIITYDAQDMNGISAFKKVPNATKVRITITDTTSVPTDYQIMLSFSAIQTEFIPYTKDTLNVDFTKWFTDGEMRGVNNVRDTLERIEGVNKFRAVKRLGIVDLGQKCFQIDTYGQDAYSLYLNDFNPKWVANGVLITNAKCNRYEVVGENDIYYGRKDKCLNLPTRKSNYINVRDTKLLPSGLTLEQVKQNLQGVMLVYELAEPIITDIAEKLDYGYNYQNGGLEYWTWEYNGTTYPSNPPTYTEIVYKKDLVLKLAKVLPYERQHEIDTEQDRRITALEGDMAHYSADIVNLELDKADKSSVMINHKFIGNLHDISLYNQIVNTPNVMDGALFRIDIQDDTPQEAINKGFPQLESGSVAYGYFYNGLLDSPMIVITDKGMFKIIDGGTLTCEVIDGEDFEIEYRVASQHQFNISTPQLANLIKGLRVWYQYEFQGKKRLQHQDIYFTDKGDADATSYISNGLNIVGFLADTIAIEFDMTTGVIALRSTGTMPQTFKLVDLKGLR